MDMMLSLAHALTAIRLAVGRTYSRLLYHDYRQIAKNKDKFSSFFLVILITTRNLEGKKTETES